MLGECPDLRQLQDPGTPGCLWLGKEGHWLEENGKHLFHAGKGKDSAGIQRWMWCLGQEASSQNYSGESIGGPGSGGKTRVSSFGNKEGQARVVWSSPEAVTLLHCKYGAQGLRAASSARSAAGREGDAQHPSSHIHSAVTHTLFLPSFMHLYVIITQVFISHLEVTGLSQGW